ncbi:MAG: GNAT family N-acetyltransferase [Verrucomicrobia bacterium]|nr:GNAT family N-acetyltransferase [Verrucomicrobiota bacterium]
MIPSVQTREIPDGVIARLVTNARGQGHGVVETLVRAFTSDPVAVHLFPDPAVRVRGMAHVFMLALRSAWKSGCVDVIQPNDAAAIWLRPGHDKARCVQLIGNGALAAPFLVGWGATRRMLRYEKFVEQRRARLMGRQPYWYLFAIGVLPNRCGAGLGSALLEAGRRRASEDRFPCYLETSNEHNLAFYQKRGFSIIDRQTLPDTQLTVWSLMLDHSAVRETKRPCRVASNP